MLSEDEMKVFADLSALFKVVAVCLVLGFILGICMTERSCVVYPARVPVAPAPAPAASAR
jgi:hypothetical protein